MNETKQGYTPGPWSALPVVGQPDASGHYWIAAREYRSVCQTIDNSGTSQAERAANARLISAAPDLADALAEMYRVAETIPEFFGTANRTRKKALAALEKAGVTA